MKHAGQPYHNRVDAAERKQPPLILHADTPVYQCACRAHRGFTTPPELFPFELNSDKERLVEDARFSVGNPAQEFTVNLRGVRGLDHKTDGIKELGVIEAADAQPIADIRNLDHRARLRLWPLSRHDRIT